MPLNLSSNLVEMSSQWFVDMLSLCSVGGADSAMAPRLSSLMILLAPATHWLVAFIFDVVLVTHPHCIVLPIFTQSLLSTHVIGICR